MTMLETKKAIEDALFLGNPLSFDAMMNAYVAVQSYLVRCGNKELQVIIDTSDVKTGG